MECIKKTLIRHQPAKELPDGLLMEILPRLPVKSLLRFRCISKSWLALVLDAHNRKKLPPTMSGLFYFGRSNNISVHNIMHYISTQKGLGNCSSIDANLSFLTPHQNLMIFDSCNGLLRCGVDNHPTPSCLYVCNPASKKWAPIPIPHRQKEYVILSDYDPRVSHHFNIFRVCKLQSSSRFFSFQVFSSKTGKWVVSQVNNTKFELRKYRKVEVFFNGIIHLYDFCNFDIFGINRDGEVCRRIKHPGNYCIGNVYEVQLGQSGGYLHCALKLKKKLCIWDLVDYYDSDS